MNAATVRAPAKVNLWLRVLARETTGYHSLESLFCALHLADEVRVSRGGDGVALRVEGGIATGPEEDNLAVRAARRFLSGIGEAGGVAIELHKRIPAAAGLGGGSSDAAATLRALNTLFGEPLSGDVLLQLGTELGSDVPFFLCGSPLALGWSRGERLLSLPPLPEAQVILAHPGEAMPTSGAFHRIADLRGGEYRPEAASIRAEELGSWQAIAARAVNDFEAVARERVRKVGTGLEVLRRGGARIAQLAGSGASIFGVFHDDALPESVAEALREQGFTVWATRTLAAMPAVESSTPAAG